MYSIGGSYVKTEANGQSSTAVGAGAQAYGLRSVSLGATAYSYGDDSIAVGRNAITHGDYTLAIGYLARTSHDGNIAIGRNTAASAQNSVVIGASAQTHYLGHQATALGAGTYVGGVSGGTAIGHNARVGLYVAPENWWESGSFLGVNSVALGADSFADRDDVVSIGNATTGQTRQITNLAAGTEATDAVNLAQLDAVAGELGELGANAVVYDGADKAALTLAGADGTVIGNVAAGEVSADSMEAVNGSQLFETNTRVGVVEGRVDDLDSRIGDVAGVAANAIAYDDAGKATATLGGADGTVLDNVAAGAVGTDSRQAVNGGQLHAGLQATADALGGGAAVTAFGTLSAPAYAIQGGTYFSVGDALGALDAQIGRLDTRIDQLASQGGSGDEGVSVGGDQASSVGEGTNAVAIGAGAAANGANGVAVGGDAYAHGPDDTAIGGNAKVGADGSTAVGANSTITAAATNAVAVGEGASVSAASGTALGQGASVTAEGAVALGQGSVADRADTVSVGSAGNERQIANVAAGTADTDAANVAQLNAGVAEARAYADTTATQAVTTANRYTDAKFTALSDSFDGLRREVDERFERVDRRFDRMAAMSGAYAGMAMNTAGLPGRNRLGVGVGAQGGEEALAVGYQRAIGERASVSFGGAISGGEKSVMGGAGFSW
nr:YadA-like family protein [Luteimonas sp. XNQY3]